MKGFLKGQMVEVINYKEVGDNKTKRVLFKVADRNKRGSGKDQTTDFFLCKAFGRNAETIEKYFDIKDKDGKLKSRKIDMWGTIETYVAKTKIKNIPIKVSAKTLFDYFKKPISEEDGQRMLTLTREEYEAETSSFCFHVESIEFADYVGDINSEGIVETEEIKISIGEDKASSTQNTPSGDIEDGSKYTSNTKQEPPKIWN